MPTTPGALNSTGIGAFAAKVNAGRTGLAYVTLFDNAPPPGGVVLVANPLSLAYAIAADAAGNAYLAGSTTDPNFPVTSSALQPALSTPTPPYNAGGPPTDAFVAKLNPSGSALVWATFLGGMGFDAARSLALDPTGDVWVSGTTLSPDSPASEGVAPSLSGPGREFLAEVSPSGLTLVYAAQYPVNTVGAAMAADSAGVIHLGGGTGLVSTRTPAQTGTPHLFGLTNAAAGELQRRRAAGLSRRGRPRNPRSFPHR